MSWVFAPPSKRSNRCEMSQTDIFQGPSFASPLLVIRVVEFSREGYRIRKILGKKSTYPKKITEFWELVWWGGVKKCQPLTFKVNFPCEKSSGSFSFLFHLKSQFTSTFFPSIFKSLHYCNDVQLLTASNYTNSQNSIISFGYVDFYSKIFPILYPSLENSNILIIIPLLIKWSS